MVFGNLKEIMEDVLKEEKNKRQTEKQEEE